MPKSEDGSILIVLDQKQQEWLAEHLEHELDYFCKLGTDATVEDVSQAQSLRKLHHTLTSSMNFQR